VPVLGLHSGFQRGGDAIGLLQPAPAGKPAWAFRHGPADPPHNERGDRPDQHHPAPAGDAEGDFCESCLLGWWRGGCGLQAVWAGGFDARGLGGRRASPVTAVPVKR